MKFIVKVIQVPDIGHPDVSEFALQAPSHVSAILDAIEQVGEAEAELPSEARSVAYVAERIDPRPEDEPAEIFFIRKTSLDAEPWKRIAGEDVRDATDEEARMLESHGFKSGCVGMRNENFRELPRGRKRR